MEPTVWRRIVRELNLSPQQARIVECLLRGMRDKQIAAELRLTLPTVRSYFARLFTKLGVRDRVELILRIFAIAQRRRQKSPRRTMSSE